MAIVLYSLLIVLADAWLTGTAPNYGSRKMLFAAVVVVIATTITIAITSIEPGSTMRPSVWAAVIGFVVVLAVDGILPRAVAEIRPQMWPSTTLGVPPYWAPAEVKPIPNQPIVDSPIACVVLPPGASEPSGLPFGQQNYACTRQLVGLAGLKGKVGGLITWLASDWSTNTNTWNEYAPSLDVASDEAKRHPIIVLDIENNAIGLETLNSLLRRYPSTP
jgi:nitrate/nitrite transporter NarK